MDGVHRLIRRRCLGTLISAAVVAVCVCIGVTMNLTTIYDANFDHMGIRTFCMFTVNSNILCGIGMMMVLPYAIDGLRTKNFHLPNWVVDLLFAGVTAVALTFLVSLFILSPVKGFELIFSGSRFFLHGLCPILAIIAFCYFMPNHVITRHEFVFALIPVFLYSVVYYVMVVIIGPSRGGWDDFYGFVTRIPAWISLVLIMPITLGIAFVLRHFHNRSCRSVRQREAELYEREFAGEKTEDLIADVARRLVFDKKAGTILVPVWLLKIVIRDSGSDMDLATASDLFLEATLKEISR